MRFVPIIAELFMRTLHLTLRTRHINSAGIERMNADGTPYIVAFWHCHILMAVFCRHRKPITVMISQHRDGEMIATTIERFGIGTARGSSTRGGMTALREMIRLVEQGERIAITPDGPRGPRCIAQIGVVTAAQMTGAPVIPLAFIAEHKKRLRSWDRFEIPRPFSRGVYIYGDPIHVPRELTEEQVEACRLEIERKMNAITSVGEEHFRDVYRTRRLDVAAGAGV